jgi:hypothetical protein
LVITRPRAAVSGGPSPASSAGAPFAVALLVVALPAIAPSAIAPSVVAPAVSRAALSATGLSATGALALVNRSFNHARPRRDLPAGRGRRMFAARSKFYRQHC